MPELVVCPACGCKVQMAETFIGKRVRCLVCSESFTASADQSPAPPSADSPPTFGILDWQDDSRPGLPLCPKCGRRVGWDVVVCPHCGEEFELEHERAHRLRRMERGVRRDSEPHRGRLLASLGNVCLITGGLSVCVCGLGGVVSVPLGIVTWVLAQRDLGRMRQGMMDPTGRDAAENGRLGAILGIVLGLIFAGCHAVFWLNLW